MRVISAFLTLAVAAVLIGCNRSADEASANSVPGPYRNLSMDDAIEAARGDLEIIIEQEGEGEPAEEGDLILVSYRGSLLDGTVFDSNDEQTEPPRPPFTLVLGQGMVIQGWEQGLLGIREGEVRRIEIPWPLAYGPQGSPPTIPPYAPLTFIVTCHAIVRTGESDIFDITDETIGTGREVQEGDWVQIRYQAFYTNGVLFEESADFGDVVQFRVRSDERQEDPMPGMDWGLLGMREGGRRIIRMNPGIAYGEFGGGTVGGNQVVIFEIELVTVTSEPNPDLLPPG